jgi:hypothetical protein
MKDLGKIAIGFDYTKVDYTSAFEIKPARPAPATTPTNNNRNNPVR